MWRGNFVLQHQSTWGLGAAAWHGQAGAGRGRQGWECQGGLARDRTFVCDMKLMFEAGYFSVLRLRRESMADKGVRFLVSLHEPLRRVSERGAAVAGT